MKKIKYLFLVLAAFFSMVFLAGCEKSAQINTTLTFDKEMKGERTMHVELSKESFAENVTGSMEDLQAIFKENCPEELTYEFSETESSYVADIHLAFDSEDDYYEKVEEITEIEKPGSINTADSVFRSGIEVKEEFESKDLLGWLVDALIEKQFVTAENESYIFDNSGCIVKYEGAEYTSSNSYIYVSQVTSAELDRIRIKTSLNLDGTWNREISFYVPKDSMAENGDEIKKFLEEGVAKGAEGSWEEYKENGEKGRVYTIKAANIPVETVEKLMQKAFHTKKSQVSDETESLEGSTNLVCSSALLKETYDLSEFVSGSYSNLYVEYIVGNGEKETSDMHAVRDGKCSISQEFNTYIVPSGIHLTSRVKGSDNYNRVFEFTFQNLKEEEKKFLKNQAENLVEGLGKVSTKDKKDAYTLKFSVKGDKEKTSKLYKKLFGYDMDASYLSEHKWMGFSNTFAYEENVDLSRLLPRNLSRTVDVNYELSFGAGARVSSKLENAYEKKGNTLYLSGSDKSPINVSLYGTRVNFRGIISTVLLILAVISLVFFGILLLAGRKRKEKEQETAGQPVAASGEKQAEAEVVQQMQEALLPDFCTNCGAKFEDAEQTFCTNCGKKRGE